MIEDAKEPSSADCSLIYKEKEDGGDADGDPYKLKLLCSSDGSVNIEDKEGKLSLSAQKVEPGDGLEWKKGQDQDGNDIDTQILQIKIDSTAVDSKTPGENGKWPLALSVSPEGLAGELDLTVDTSVHDLGGGAKVGLSTEAGALSLIDTPGGAAEELSFRAPLRKNGKYVVLDYESSWSDAVNGVKAGLFIRNNKLAVELYAETAPDGSDSLISDSWTVLFCDSDHAIRLHRDENGKIYIQQGEWIVTSKIYAPIN